MSQSTKRIRPISRIRRVSNRRRREGPARRKCVAFVRERSGGRCELRCSPHCRGYGEHGHELLKQSQGGDPTNVNNVKFACDPCNDWCENWPKQAEEMGFVIRRDDARAAALRRSKYGTEASR